MRIRAISDALGRCDWSELRSSAPQARAIVDRFSRWALGTGAESRLGAFRDACPILWEESVAVARIISAEPASVFAANLTYDVAASCCGCTAFSVDHAGAPLHCHCLDWEDNAEVLAANPALVDFIDRSGRVLCTTTGWPGFLGAFVGVAPGRFAVSMNAAWSEGDAPPGESVAILIRRVLLTAPSFPLAVDMLSESLLASSCILLVTGTEPDEAVVIERTPSKSAVRHSVDGVLLATNHFRSLDAGSNRANYVTTGQEPFGEGSVERYTTATSILDRFIAQSGEEVRVLLQEEPFTNSLTIQRVSMCANTGSLSSFPASRDQSGSPHGIRVLD